METEDPSTFETVSNPSEEPPQHTFADYVEIGYLLFTMICGVSLNLLALRKMFADFPKDGKQRSELKTAFLYLKVNLNICNLLILIVHNPIKIGWLITYQWLPGDMMCRTCQFLSMISFQLSSNMVAAIAFDRFKNVRRLMRLEAHKQARNARKRLEKPLFDVKILLGFSWGLAIGISIPQLLIWQSFEVSDGWNQCSTIWEISRHELNVRLIIQSTLTIDLADEICNGVTVPGNLTSEYLTNLTSFEQDQLFTKMGQMYPWERRYAHVHLLTIFWIPFCIIFLCYFLMGRKLLKFSCKSFDSRNSQKMKRQESLITYNFLQDAIRFVAKEQAYLVRAYDNNPQGYRLSAPSLFATNLRPSSPPFAPPTKLHSTKKKNNKSSASNGAVLSSQDRVNARGKKAATSRWKSATETVVTQKGVISTIRNSIRPPNRYDKRGRGGKSSKQQNGIDEDPLSSLYLHPTFGTSDDNNEFPLLDRSGLHPIGHGKKSRSSCSLNLVRIDNQDIDDPQSAYNNEISFLDQPQRDRSASSNCSPIKPLNSDLGDSTNCNSISPTSINHRQKQPPEITSNLLRAPSNVIQVSLHHPHGGPTSRKDVARDIQNRITKNQIPNWRIQMRSKMFRASGLIVTAYVLFWTPYNVLCLLQTKQYRSDHVIDGYLDWLKSLMVLNAVVNPILYEFT